MKFTVHATAIGSMARRATIVTSRGHRIDTPAFMPVGTRGTVRTQTLAQLARIAPAPAIILGNTYHLMARPGPELLAAVGGLAAWMKWPGALLTDSGGFQIFSLQRAREITEDGALFTSYVDGKKLVLTPERSIAMQRAIGSDIMMVLDQCIASTASEAEARAAMALTHRWARRSLAAARGEVDGPVAPGPAGAVFAIVQGACVPALRRESVAELVAIGGFDGYAVGGLAVGESRAEREDITELVTPLLPADRPRYLMGVGTPVDLLEGVHRGIDMFDCVLPTAWAQQGIAFTSHGRVDLRRGVHRASEVALDAACACDACTTYARSYLHHLVKCREPLGWQLLAFHNLQFYARLMADIRAALDAGTFAALYRARRDELAAIDRDNPPGPAPRPTARHAGPPDTLGAFAVHRGDRFASIRHIASGEIMHSVNAPDDEAERLYVAQSRLIARALAAATSPPTSPPTPLRVWDVGLGAAHNAMAVIRAFAAAGAPLELVSFERDLDAFRLALANQKAFPHLREEAPHRLAHAGAFARGPIAWRLVTGDFAATFADHAPPDVLLWDPFSAATDTPMWSLALFTRLRAHLGDRATELFTYTSSTAVRTSLLLAGFAVARGAPTGPKRETTIALTGAATTDRHALLGRDWLERRARSTAQFAADIAPADHAALEARLAALDQFR